MERLTTDFYYFLENEKKMKSNTLLSYKRDIKAFFEHINDFSISIDLIPNFFESYMDKLKKSNKSSSTISRNIASLRNFFKFLMSRQVISNDPTFGHKSEKRRVNVNLHKNLLTISEINSIISIATTNDFKGYRDRAILETLYACGLKVSELLNIKLKDLHLSDNYITIVSDEKTRYAPLYKDAVIAINNYIKKARNSLKNANSDFLFLNKNSAPLTRQSLWSILKSYGKKASINKDVNPNVFRQSMAIHLMENGANLNDLQNLFGHKYISLHNKNFMRFKPNIISIYDEIHPKA